MSPDKAELITRLAQSLTSKMQDLTLDCHASQGDFQNFMEDLLAGRLNGDQEKLEFAVTYIIQGSIAAGKLEVFGWLKDFLAQEAATAGE